jgi:hypothetical protein
MKAINVLILFSFIFTFTNWFSTPACFASEKLKPVKGEFYQLKTYLFNNEEQVQITEKYLKEAYLPALKRQKITTVGVFKVRTSEKDTTLKLLVLIPSQSPEKLLLLEKELENDATYLSAGKAYLDALHNAPPFQRIETTLLKAFEGMPMMKAPTFDNPRSERVYELRSYESATESYFKRKVEMFNSGEIALFEKLGFNAVFYGEVLAGNTMPNLMYMTTFANEESRKKHWDSFGNSPEWNVMKAIPKYENTVSHITILYLFPTDYSDY